MHVQLSTIRAALLLPVSSVFAGVLTPPSASTLDITRRGAPEEHSVQILDDRSALLATGDERLPRLSVRDDDDDDDDDSVLDKIRDKASDFGDDIKDEASDIKDDVKDEVDDVFDDGVGTLRPGIILPGLLAVIVVVVAGM